VSAVNSHQRHLQDRAIREATAESTWQGKAGDKVSFDAKILATRSYTRAGRGGHTTATTVYLADVSENLFTWRAGNLNAFRDGTFVRVNGRIKGHETADGHKQTELTRCVLTPIDMSAKSPPKPLSRVPGSRSEPASVPAVAPPLTIEATSASPDDPAEQSPPEPDPLALRRAQVRQRQLVLAIEQYGPSYQRVTGDGVRYASEAANATREERDWMAEYVRTNPQALEGESLGDGRIRDINRQASRQAFAAATAAITKADFKGALDRLDDAEVHWPAGHPDRGGAWDKYRAVVLRRAASPLDTATPANLDDRPDSGVVAGPEGAAALARVSYPAVALARGSAADQLSIDAIEVPAVAGPNRRSR
jgi:hypothetical protein